MHNICDMVGIPEEHRRTIAYEVPVPRRLARSAAPEGAEPLARVAQAIMTRYTIAAELVRGPGAASRRTIWSPRWCRPRSTESGSPMRRFHPSSSLLDHRRQRHHAAVHLARHEGAHRFP